MRVQHSTDLLVLPKMKLDTGMEADSGQVHETQMLIVYFYQPCSQPEIYFNPDLRISPNNTTSNPEKLQISTQTSTYMQITKCVHSTSMIQDRTDN